MATFPHNLCDIRQDGHAEQHQPIMLRTEMERGVARQRRQSADSRISVPCTLVFRSASAAAEFEAWYYAEGYAWFDFTLPRTGQVVQARIIGGDIGSLSPITPAWNASERSIVLEYNRPNFVTLATGSYSIDSSRILSVQRSTTATYIDDAGVLQTAPANVARYQGGQLLVEGEATNLLTYSQEFQQVAWVKSNSTVSTNVATAPDGSTSAEKLVENTSNAAHSVGQTFAFVSGSTYTLSVFAKASERSVVQLSFPGTAFSNAYANFNLTSGSVTLSNNVQAEMTALSNGWFRCSVTGVANASSASSAAIVVQNWSLATRFFAYTGTGVDGIYIWGAQLAGSTTSYIPTTTAAASRAADLITVAA